MAFDGIVFQGQSLKIRRPRDYQAVQGGGGMGEGGERERGGGGGHKMSVKVGKIVFFSLLIILKNISNQFWKIILIFNVIL